MWRVNGKVNRFVGMKYPSLLKIKCEPYIVSLFSNLFSNTRKFYSALETPLSRDPTNLTRGWGIKLLKSYKNKLTSNNTIQRKDQHYLVLLTIFTPEGNGIQEAF